MNDTVPTLFCINAAYAQHAAVCIVSLLENNADLRFDIVVVSTEHLGSAEDALRASIARYSNVHMIVTYLEAARDLIVHGGHRSVDTYSRLWVAEFFPETVEKVLYLDSDIVVVGSIAELWRMDLDGRVLGATTIPGSTSRCGPLGIPEKFGYFQAGVLLINLKNWRQRGVFERVKHWLISNGAQTDYTDDDQTALNACLYDQRVVLPDIWNVIAPFYFDYHPLGISEQVREEIRRAARIIHFNVPSKPWHYMSRHPRRAEYWNYLKHTEWRDYQPPDRNIVNWGKKQFGPYVPKRVRNNLKRVLNLS